MEDGGERWSKPYVATLSLHSLFELRSCILNGTVLLDMRASGIEEIAGEPLPHSIGPAPRGASRETDSQSSEQRSVQDAHVGGPSPQSVG